MADKSTPWTSGFEATPSGASKVREGDDRIRELKTAVQERFVQEHEMDLTEAGLQPRQGSHKAGSAVAFSQAVAPTERNGVALAATDNGILWHETDTGKLWVWVNTDWVDISPDTAGVDAADDIGDATGASTAAKLLTLVKTVDLSLIHI